MQKFNDPCIKTGDFARLCGTNKRTLIHYDEIGLFKPAYTDDRATVITAKASLMYFLPSTV